jgi:4-hydroxybenzoate polyprenyltransferase
MPAYLQLVRLPTVFTAMADIVLGFVLTHGFLYGPGEDSFNDQMHWVQPGQFVGLLIASCSLYLSGMVFNDVFDRKQDAGERPGRPIPSGRVSLQNAIALGTVLMVAGLVSATSVNRASLQVGLLLVVAILGYDAFLKRTPLGPLMMGSCRFLNVMLGASAKADDLASLFASPQLVAAAGLGVYITGVTLFARTEARASSRWQLGFAQIVMNAGIAVLAWLIMKFPILAPQRSPIHVALGMLMVVTFTVNRRALDALRNPEPATVQAGIKVMLLSHAMLDATLVYWFLSGANATNLGTVHAMATAALVIPAMFLSRYIPMT